MADGDNSDRPFDVGYGKPPKRTQFAKGKSGNPSGRSRKPRKRTIDLYTSVMEDVTITRNGKKKKVPFPIAHIERIKERAAKGDPKADQALFQSYKIVGLFDPVSADEDEPYEFTIRITHPTETLPGHNAAESDSSNEGEARDTSTSNPDYKLPKGNGEN